MSVGKLGHTGSGGVASYDADNLQRKERLRSLMLENVDVSKDPYFMINHYGGYECKLCLTIHTNEGNYLAHTQGKRHQLNLQRRAAKLKREQERSGGGGLNAANNSIQRGSVDKPYPSHESIKRIGFPAYRIVKQYDHTTEQRSLLFQIDYPEIYSGIQPRARLMSAFEHQTYIKQQQQQQPHRYSRDIKPPPRLTPADPNYQYLLVAADPYNIIGFALPCVPIDRTAHKFFTHWDNEKNIFTLQLFFKKIDKNQEEKKEEP